MKRSFYLFNPGIMERRDNTLKFTPIVVNEDNTEIKQHPRYIPIEVVAELYAFGILRANSALFNFLGQKGKKIFVKAMEERYDETFRHRSLGRNVSYKHLIKLECYKLLKEILGIEEYKPFKMYW